MHLFAFQEHAKRTMAKGSNIGVLALGVAGEAGEVADLIKKHIGHGHDLDREKLIGELGDVLWYLAAMCEAIETNLEVVATENIRKLRKRYPDGFSAERSRSREQ